MPETDARPALTGFEGTFGGSLGARREPQRSVASGTRQEIVGQTIGKQASTVVLSRPGSTQARVPEAGQASGTPEIFLSPRVIDRQAFEDYSRALRELINEAAAGSEMLRQSAVDAEQAKTSLRETIASQQATIEHSTKLIALLDQRAVQTRQTLEGALDTTRLVEAVRESSDVLMSERLAHLNRRIEEAVRLADERVSSVDRRLSPLMKEADRRIQTLNGQVDAQLSPTIAGLQSLCDRAEAIIGKAGTDGTGGTGLADLVNRAEAARTETSIAVGRLEVVREQAEQSSRVLEHAAVTAGPLIGEVSRLHGTLETAMARAKELSASVQDKIATEASTLRETAAGAIGQLGVESARVRSELSGVIEQAHQARRAAAQAASTGEEAASHLSGLLDRLEPWHSVLLAPNGDDDLPLPLQDVLNRVRVDLRRDLAGVASALRAVADRTETVLGMGGQQTDVLSETKTVPTGRVGVRPIERNLE